MFVLKKKFTINFFIIVLLAGLLLVNRFVYAQESPTPTPSSSNSASSELQNRINELKNKISEIQGQAKTLSSQISIMDNQIKLTEVRIEANKREILDISLDIDTATKKISTLEDSLDTITGVLLNRIVATYEAGRVHPFEILLSSSDASNLLLRLNYLKIAQAHDKKLIYDVQQAKNDYTNQKEIFEEKKQKIETLKAQLEQYTKQLEQDKAGKEELLNVTKNDEAKYQTLLTQALAERKAIFAAFSQAVSRLNSGEGEAIGKGQAIAVVGNSGGPDCSSGSHLHFTILQNSSPTDPAQKLRNVSPNWDNSPDGQFDFTGDWDWPISNPKITQGYGMTYWARIGWYGGNIHDGIDMAGGPTIIAPKSGRVIYGSTICDSPSVTGVSTLKYVAIKHDDDSSVITLYLHIQ